MLDKDLCIEAICILVKQIPDLFAEYDKMLLIFTRKEILASYDIKYVKNFHESTTKIYRILNIKGISGIDSLLCNCEQILHTHEQNALVDMFPSLAYHFNHICTDFEMILKILKSKIIDFSGEEFEIILSKSRKTFTRAWMSYGVQSPVSIKYL